MSVRLNRFTIVCLVAIVVADTAYYRAAKIGNKKGGGLIESNGVGDLVCGPRCLQFLLEYYHVDLQCSLMDLVLEVQWPEFQKGASLAALQRSLRSRGVHTLVLRGHSYKSLSWQYPILLHLNNTTMKKGHYVIALPSTATGLDRFWVGLEGVKVGLAENMQTWVIDYIMITSPTPISNLVGQSPHTRLDTARSRPLPLKPVESPK